MEAQELFYLVGIVALILVSAFVVFFFYVMYRFNKLARAGFQALTFVAQDMRESLGAMAKGWGRVTVASLIIKAIKSYFKR
jgi:hypothetical protein